MEEATRANLTVYVHVGYPEGVGGRRRITAAVLSQVSAETVRNRLQCSVEGPYM